MFSITWGSKGLRLASSSFWSDPNQNQRSEVSTDHSQWRGRMCTVYDSRWLNIPSGAQYCKLVRVSSSCKISRTVGACILRFFPSLSLSSSRFFLEDGCCIVAVSTVLMLEVLDEQCDAQGRQKRKGKRLLKKTFPQPTQIVFVSRQCKAQQLLQIFHI